MARHRIYLIVMRSSDENNGSISWNVESASWPNLSEEDINDSAPEDEGRVVDQVRRQGETVVRSRHDLWHGKEKSASNVR